MSFVALPETRRAEGTPVRSVLFLRNLNSRLSHRKAVYSRSPQLVRQCQGQEELSFGWWLDLPFLVCPTFYFCSCCPSHHHPPAPPKKKKGRLWKPPPRMFFCQIHLLVTHYQVVGNHPPNPATSIMPGFTVLESSGAVLFYHKCQRSPSSPVVLQALLLHQSPFELQCYL